MQESGSGSLPPVLLSWSGGKDSMMCLHRLRGDGTEVRALVTTVTGTDGMVSGQGVHVDLVRRQAEALDLPLEVVALPAAPSNEQYTRRLGSRLKELAAEGDLRIAFGDLFLADIRRWREDFLARYGLEAAFPLWGADTAELAADFLGLGYRAWITCVDSAQLPASFAGRALTAAIVRAMGPGRDPCGENGEYHSFVWDGPAFARPVPCRPGAALKHGTLVYRPPLPESAD